MSTVSLPIMVRLRDGLARMDRALALLAAAVAAVLVLDPTQLPSSSAFVARAAFGVAPFLLASAAAAAWVKAADGEQVIARAFQGRSARMIVAASLVGALSPFCSCGVIPIIGALLASGVPLAPVMAFWVSSPLMDPAMFFLTAGTLGAGFAFAKTLAAFGVGLLGGFTTAALARAGLLPDPLRAEFTPSRCASSRLAPRETRWRFWTMPQRRERFRDEFADKAIFLGKWLLIAFFLESLMVAYVPRDFVARIAGGEGLGSLAVAAAVGVPAYLNGYAALPLASGLLTQGMTPASVMTFLIAGGATSVPAAIAVWAIVRARVFAVYVAIAISGALLAGLAYAALG